MLLDPPAGHAHGDSMSSCRFKWGLPGDGRQDCEVEVEDEEGNWAWRQAPFETLADMLPAEQATLLGADVRRLF
jgi:hypothetical protein